MRHKLTVTGLLLVYLGFAVSMANCGQAPKDGLNGPKGSDGKDGSSGSNGTVGPTGNTGQPGTNLPVSIAIPCGSTIGVNANGLQESIMTIGTTAYRFWSYGYMAPMIAGAYVSQDGRACNFTVDALGQISPQ